MNIAEIELASRSAWPALEEQDSECGLLRYAAGVSRRANSMSPSLMIQPDPAAIITTSENFFRRRRQPSIVRVITPHAHLATSTYLLDCALAEASYRCEAPTAVMVRPFTGNEAFASVRDAGNVQVLERVRWLQAWYDVKSRSAVHCQVHQKMLARISDPGCFVAHIDSAGEVSATAMAVLSGSALGIYGVATRGNKQRQGLATRLIAQLLDWGRAQGASYAYLQVESANAAAIKLYQKLGFGEYYNYWYRVKPMTSMTTMEHQ